MSNLPPELHQKLYQLAVRYAGILKARVINALQRYNATGELINSIEIKIIPGKGDMGPQIQMTYEDHGDFLTKKKMFFVKVPPVEDLKKWSEARGINLYKIPGYKEGSIPNISDDKKRNRIAWAIGIDKRMNDTWKRKAWKKKPISELLKELNEEIIIQYIREVEVAIASELSNQQINGTGS